MSTITVTTTAPPDDLALLPQPARDKLERLRAARDDAHVLLTAAYEKAAGLRTGATLAGARRELAELEKADSRNLLYRDTNAVSEPQAAVDGPPRVDRRPERDTARLTAARERVEKLEAELAKADALRDRRSEAWQALARLVTHIEEWLKELSSTPELAEVEPIKLGRNKKPVDELSAARELVAALAAERKRTERAPLPAAELKVRARMLVDRRAGRVRVTGLNGRASTLDVTVSSRRAAAGGGAANPESAARETALDLMCWLNPQAMLRRLEAEIDAEANDRLALSELDLARALADLDARLLAAERREEALIMQIEAAGGDASRRPAADPRAILGLG